MAVEVSFEVVRQDNDVRLVKFDDTCYAVEFNPAQLPDIQDSEEWNIMGGSVGYSLAEFKTLAQAQEFYNKGLAGQDQNAEIWLEMLEVKTRGI